MYILITRTKTVIFCSNLDITIRIYFKLEILRKNRCIGLKVVLSSVDKYTCIFKNRFENTNDVLVKTK